LPPVAYTRAKRTRSMAKNAASTTSRNVGSREDPGVRMFPKTDCSAARELSLLFGLDMGRQICRSTDNRCIGSISNNKFLIEFYKCSASGNISFVHFNCMQNFQL
jgi:hypothetical protein